MKDGRTGGELVAGRFRLENLLGEGGMGTVWSASHVVTRKRVALKMLRFDRADAHTRHRFLREARAACAVRHPNVVEIHDVLELEDGSPVMVMELLEGESLGERLDRATRLPVDEVARLLLPVTAAVGTAHAVGIVHRDLKPDNIFIAGTSTGSVVKVLDFGIAKLTATEGDAALTGGLTGTGAMLGTPYYMSPEQIFGERDIDHRADIWALGVILYECLSGVRPTQAENVGQILKIVTTGAIKPLSLLCPGVPKDVTALVDRMLSGDRAERPQSLKDVRAVLARFGDAGGLSFDEPAPTRHAAATHTQPTLAYGDDALDETSVSTGEALVDVRVRVSAPSIDPSGASASMSAAAEPARGGTVDTSPATAETVAVPASPRRVVWPLGVAALVVVAGGALAATRYWGRPDAAPPASSAPAAGTVEAQSSASAASTVAPPGVEVVPASAPTVSPQPAAPSPAPSASASAPPAPGPRGPRAMAPVTPPVPAAAAAPAAKVPNTTLGGVVEKPPF